MASVIYPKVLALKPETMIYAQGFEIHGSAAPKKKKKIP